VASSVILLGTSITGRAGETARRESAAQASLTALIAAGLAQAANLLFFDEGATAGEIPSLPRLTLDAPGVSGVPGPRKPIVSEMIDVLAAEAARRGISRIGIVNGDIVVTPAAIERIASSGAPAVAISRTDTGGGAPDAEMIYGVDLIAFDLAFWARARRLFRPYVLWETIWDNVYTAISLCHGGALLNYERLLLHERHETQKTQLPFATYGHLLGARDSAYFSRWCTYIARLELLRARAGSLDDDFALRRAVFVPPSAIEHGLDVARAAWWRAKRFAGA
jgi:hypothetical protein